MISTNDKSSPIFKSRRFRPIIYTNLITSTPAHYQATKRIKGLFGYTEHYKQNPIEDPSLGRILPFRSKDYRKARELNLELWDPETKLDSLETFLKAQTNVKNIRIRVLKREQRLTNILRQLSEILGKCSRINRVQIDFEKEKSGLAVPHTIERLSPLLRNLPKLKDISITVDGGELYPFSIALLLLGFDFPLNQFLLTTPNASTIQHLMKKVRKFHQFDTIQIDSKALTCLPEVFLDSIALVVSKLPNVRELNLNYSKDIYLAVKPTFSILDTLFKTAPKLQILKLGLAMKGIASISMLKHPILKAKTLAKVHISLTFYREITPVNLTQILDLLQGTPKLYELSLNFMNYLMMSDDIVREIMEKLVLMVNLRKLRIRLECNSLKISEKQTGSLIRSIFKMSSLEELDLEIRTNGLDLSGNMEGDSLGTDIQGLPRLVKMRLVLVEYENSLEQSVFGMMGLLGRCCRLRELEMDVKECEMDNEEMTRILRENIGKLKGLQKLKLRAAGKTQTEELEGKTLILDVLRQWVKIFGWNEKFTRG